jgi:hypothetical protein
MKVALPVSTPAITSSEGGPKPKRTFKVPQRKGATVSDETREHSHATRDAAASAEQESRTHPRAGVITAADLLAGAVMPMRLRLNVTVRPGTPEHPEHVQSATPRQPVSLDTRLSQLTAELL